MGGVIGSLSLWLAVISYGAATYTGQLASDQAAGDLMFVKKDRKVKYSMLPDSNTVGFIGTAVLERSRDAGGRFKTVATFTGTSGSGITAEQTGVFYNDIARSGLWMRFRIEDIEDENTSGSITWTLTEDFDATHTKMVSNGGRVGATSGWTFAPDTGALGQLPASNTGSTMVVPLDLEEGDIIIGYNLHGQIEGDDGTGSIHVTMNKLTAAADDLTVSVLGAMSDDVTSQEADLLLSSSNTGVTLAVPEELTVDEVVYLVITGTTLSVTDIDLQSVEIDYTKRSLFP